MSQSNTRKLQVVQNRACKLLLKCSLDAPVEQMHLDLGWPMLRDRFAIVTWNMFFRILVSHEPQNIYSSIVQPTHFQLDYPIPTVSNYLSQRKTPKREPFSTVPSIFGTPYHANHHLFAS